MADTPSGFSRRDLLILGGAAAPLVYAVTARGGGSTGEDADWPNWARPRTTLYAELAELAAKGRDLRSFGAVLDGKADDTAAFERAIAAGVEVLLVPAVPEGGAIRLTRPIRIDRPIAILGTGDRSLLRWEGQGDVFLAAPRGGDPATFLTGLRLDRLRVERIGATIPKGALLKGLNLRDVSVSRCSTHLIGGLVVKHLRQDKSAARRTPIAAGADPATALGFSATRTDDLNERILVYDNHVDGGSYSSHVVRFEFARQVAAVGNVGRFAKVSWWGGAARRARGGAVEFLRRARDIYVTHNVLSGANGGVYGNNGDGIVVAHNDVSLMTDVGIDFEGCFNAFAHHNSVRNVGNFCYATFYAAKNIVFQNNFGLQDGGATRLDKVFGRGKYGRMGGRALFALRSSGFGGPGEAVSVSFLDNHFVWRGAQGTGTCLGSYFDSLTIQRNQFENVSCDMAYERTGDLTIAGNQFAYDRPGTKPIHVIGASASRTHITDNVIRSSVAQLPGSSAIFTRSTAPGQAVEIARNKVVAAGTLPIVVNGRATSRDRLIVTGNQVDRILASDPALLRAEGNLDAGGSPVRPAPLPAEFAAPPQEEPAGGSPPTTPAATEES